MSRVLILIAAALQAVMPGQTGADLVPSADLIFVPPVPEDQPVSLPATAECLALAQVRATRIIAGTGIVYQISSRRQFINRVRGNADMLQEGQIMHVRTSGSMLCAGDIVYLLDGLTGASVRFVGLGKFERYDGGLGQRH